MARVLECHSTIWMFNGLEHHQELSERAYPQFTPQCRHFIGIQQADTFSIFCVFEGGIKSCWKFTWTSRDETSGHEATSVERTWGTRHNQSTPNQCIWQCLVISLESMEWLYSDYVAALLLYMWHRVIMITIPMINLCHDPSYEWSMSSPRPLPLFSCWNIKHSSNSECLQKSVFKTIKLICPGPGQIIKT